MTRKSHSKALFPGTFNPFTLGHQAVLEAGLTIFDRVIVAVGANISKPGSVEAAEERAENIRVTIDRLGLTDRVDVIVYRGLTVDAAAAEGASHLLRGVRSVKDFEYERTLADVNRRIGGIETVVLFAPPELEWLSSTVLRDMQSHGRDISQYLP